MTKPSIGIAGGGIAGLVAAYEIAKNEGAEAVLYEASGRVGGKLLTTPFADRMVDEGADAFITRVPNAIELCEELGLGDELAAPSTSGAFIWSDGALKPLPKLQVLGVPLDIEELRASGLVSEAGIAAAEADLNRASLANQKELEIGETEPDLNHAEFASGGNQPAAGASDTAGAPDTIGALVRQRLGDEIAEKLVFPLIGSINAGNCDFLDLRATAPLLAVAAASNPSLIAGLRNLREQAQSKASASKASADAVSKVAASIFLAPKSGMGKIIRQLESRLGERICLSSPVASIEMSANELPSIRFFDKRASENFDAVVLAAPSWATADLLSESHPAAAALLCDIEYASVVLVTLSFNPDNLTDVELSGSGFLVPTSEGLTITACSWASSKWEHLRSDQAGSENARQATATSKKPSQTGAQGSILRVSLGRHDDDAIASADDERIIAAVLADLEKTMGITAKPLETRISRWPRSFPQYAPGHNEKIAQAEARLAPSGVFLAGAGYHGIGVPACIASGRRASHAALQHLGISP